MTGTQFDPEQFFRLAEELGLRDDDEAALRAAVGRAYYACVLLAAQVTGTGWKTGFHSQLARDLEEMDHRSLASYMGVMRNLRDTADYSLVPENHRERDWERNWLEVQRNAQKALPRLKAILEGTRH